MAKYKCVVVDQYEKSWLKEDEVYDGEPMIPPLIPNEAWIIIYKAKDGHKAYARANQFIQIFDPRDSLGV